MLAIIPLLAITLNPLTCNEPCEFFVLQNGKLDFLTNQVSSAFIYDNDIVNRKCLRISRSSAAYYYALISGFLERALLFGSNHGKLGAEIKMSGGEALRIMKEEDLNLITGDSEASWLNSFTGRQIKELSRICENTYSETLTKALISQWMERRRSGFIGGESGCVLPTYFDDFPKIMSTRFPDIEYLSAAQILDMVTAGELKDIHLTRSWVSYDTLGDGQVTPLSQVVWKIKNFIEEKEDQHAGSPASGFGIMNTPTNVLEGVEASFSDIVDSFVPGGLDNLTNETSRFDYKRLAAFTRLLSLEDRYIHEEPFGKIGIVSAYGQSTPVAYTNVVDVDITQEIVGIVTNKGLSGLDGYNTISGRVEMFIEIPPEVIVILTNSVSITTNRTDLRPDFAFANCSDVKENIHDIYGGATFIYKVKPETLIPHLQHEGIYHMGTINNFDITTEGTLFAIWSHESNPPTTQEVPLCALVLKWGEFQYESTTLIVGRTQKANQQWTLSPSVIGEKARKPTPYTHDNVDVINITDGIATSAITNTYDSIFPKYLFESNLFVKSMDLIFYGNLITQWDAQTIFPVFDDRYMYDKDGIPTPISEAYYNVLTITNIPSYGELFDHLWANVSNANRMALGYFTEKTGHSVGRMIPDNMTERQSMAKTLTSLRWFGPGKDAVIDTDPTEVYYDPNLGCFFNVSSNGTRGSFIYDDIKVRITYTPPASGTNTVEKPFSVSADKMSYMVIFNTNFHNLVPAEDEEESPSLSSPAGIQKGIKEVKKNDD